MKFFTPEIEGFITELRQDYLRRLEEENGIRNVEEYLSFIHDLGGVEIENDVWDFVSQSDVSLDSFFQITPYTGQDIMYCSLNPGIGSVTTEDFESGQLGDHDDSSGDIEGLALQTMFHFGSYLSSGGSEKIIRSMRQEIDQIPGGEDPSHGPFVDVKDRSDYEDSYFSHVNHTRYFKLRSPDKDFVDAFESDYWRSRFAEEVELSDPELLICGCRDAWISVYRKLVDDSETDIVAHRDSNVTHKYNRGEDDAVPGVFEIPGEDMWVVNVFHEQYSPDEEAFRQNLRYVNEKIT